MMSSTVKTPPITMSKLYVGNLPFDANETSLRDLFHEQSLSCTNILIKKGGYAFVDCPDQSSADKAIDKLNGLTFHGSCIIVEPSVASIKGRNSVESLFFAQSKPSWTQLPKVLISNLNPGIKLDDVEDFLLQFGQILHLEKVISRDPRTSTVQVAYENSQQAEDICRRLNGLEMLGRIVSVELSSTARCRRGIGTPEVLSSSGSIPIQQTNFPLRILVPSDMVGAIIGRQGSTIRQITQSTRARVDVHRKDNVGLLEKAITIYGNPDNCSKACRKILDVMQQEAIEMNRKEVNLRILAHNNLIGRLIGKGGNTIKRIMQETDTKIAVSSINDINSFNFDRIITVQGEIPNISEAEAFISSKLRQSYENDMQAIAPHTIMFPGLHPMALMSTSSIGYLTPSNSSRQNKYQFNKSLINDGNEMQETVFLNIPSNSVGAIIGTKGLNIKNIIRFSNASVKIATNDDSRPSELQNERKVTIVGSPEAQWKAQYLIFEKLREEGFVAGVDEVRLATEILVPTSQVGRIIGKGGQHIRELQRTTGCIVKLPEQPEKEQNSEETIVQMIGSFFSVQSAQRRIKSLLLQTQGFSSRLRQTRSRNLRTRADQLTTEKELVE